MRQLFPHGPYTHRMRMMTPLQARDSVARGEGAIIDVREPQEHLQASLPGVPLIPMSQFVDRVGEIPSGRTIIVMCRSGVRSEQVALYLEQEHGVGDVVNMEGGILAWATAGLPMEGVPS